MYSLYTTLLLLSTYCSAASSPGLIACRCNTFECQQQNRRVCTTSQKCYTQLKVPSEEGESAVTYGCVTSGSSLLCENRRPDIRINWPVLHCCASSFCNKDVLPTKPPAWREEEESLSERTTRAPFIPPPRRDDRPTEAALNPLYIAFPVVGALILLCLIVFAVYLLRRQPRSPSHYKYQSTLKHEPPPPPAHNALVLPRQSNHNGLVAKPCRHHNGLHTANNGLLLPPRDCGGGLAPWVAVEPMCRESMGSYPDVDRSSSSGSESKLLGRT